MQIRTVLAVVAVAGLTLAACGSDKAAAPIATVAPSVADTAAPVSAGATADTAADTVADITSSATDISVAGIGGSTEATTGDSSDDSTNDATATDSTADIAAPFDLPAILTDDLAVCRAIGDVIVTSIVISFSGFSEEFEATPDDAAGTSATDVAASDSANADDPDATRLEELEVALYIALEDQVATIRRDVPAHLQPSLEPLLVRVDAVPEALVAGGFTDVEIAAIRAAAAATLADASKGLRIDELGDPAADIDRAKIKAAALDLIDAVGTFDSYTSEDAEEDEFEDEGNEWIVATCPILDESLNS